MLACVSSAPYGRHLLCQSRLQSKLVCKRRGFTYIGLLILVAILGIAASASVVLGALMQRRAAETELLFIGQQFREALIQYANSTSPGQRRTPHSLGELLRDPRYPQQRRYLRQVFADPLSGSTDWGLVTAPDGGIVGVYSKSLGKPIKISQFEAPFAHFAGQKEYAGWVFSVEPLVSIGVIQTSP